MIRVRKLQHKNSKNQWYDDAYIVEDAEGCLTFHYNLAWDRVGARINGQLKEGNVTIEEIETLVPPGDKMRWLAVEEIKEAQSKAFLEELDARCSIPKPRSIKEHLGKTLAA